MFIEGKYIASGTSVLDAHIIARESYNASHDYVPINTWTDASGAEHEEYYPNRRLNVSFNTSDMDEQTLSSFLSWINSNCIPGTKDMIVTAWVPSENKYISQRCKVVGVNPVIDTHIKSGHLYKSMAISFEGRGSLT